MKILTKGKIVVAMALMTTICVIGASTNMDKSELAAQLNAVAVGMMQRGDMKSALLKFEEALVVDPACAEATRNYAKLLILGGRYEKAEELLIAELKRNPDDAGCLVPLAQIYALQGKTSSFASMLDRIGLAHDRTLLKEMPILLLKQGSLEAAEVAAKKAVDDDVKDAVRWFNMGTVLERREKWDNAAESYAKATALRKDYFDAWINLGNVRERQKRYDEMLSCYETAYELDPESPFAQYNLGRVLTMRVLDVDRGLGLLQSATRGKGAAAAASRKLLTALIAKAEQKGGTK